MKTVKDVDFSFFLYVIREYFDKHKALVLLMVLYVICLIYLVIKGKKTERYIFVYPSIVLILTVLNPLLMINVFKVINLSARYYRFLWLLPLTITVVYTFIKLIEKSGTKSKIAAFVLIAAICIVGYARGNTFRFETTPDNLYKIPDEMITLTEIVSEDKSEKNPTLIYGSTLMAHLRPYDPSIISYFDRNQVRKRTEGEPLDYQDKKSFEVLRDSYFGNEPKDKAELSEALRTEGIDYVLFRRIDTELIDEYVSAGCSLVGETENYGVYSVE